VIRERNLGSVLFDVVNHILLIVAALACLVPMIHSVAISLSEAAPAAGYKVGLWPVGFNIANYKWILRTSQFRQSFFISVMRTLGGTLITIFVTVLTAYPLSLAEGFRGKQVFKWLLIVSMLFSGGLIPWYLALRSLHLINNLWGLILPGAVATWNIIIALNFFRGLPPELAESAEIDGASHWVILFRIYLPLSLPMLATITLFTAVGHWNAWFDAQVLITDVTKYPLQTYLRSTVLQTAGLGLGGSVMNDPELLKMLSDRALRGAMIVVTTLPILVLYPFLQRYFIHGLTLGSVKE